MKQKANTTASMKRKGNRSSSHSRISFKTKLKKPVKVRATQFVAWDIPALDSLRNSKVYLLRNKLNNGEAMSRAEKNWLCEKINSNTYFRTAIPLQGWKFDFLDVLKKYLVNQYEHWTAYYAPDRTSLRAYLCGEVKQIVEISKL